MATRLAARSQPIDANWAGVPAGSGSADLALLWLWLPRSRAWLLP